MRNTLIKLAAGAVGGVIGTYLMQKSLPLSGKLPARFQPPQPKQDPGHFMVSQGERIVGALSPKMHSGAVQTMPWLYGLTWPLALAALANVIGLRSAGKTIAAGAALGAIVWAVGYAGWMPATGLIPPVHRVPLRKHAPSFASHVAYGTIASLPLAIAADRLES
jgi:uncharacterized membrane protein YagU involved in acid resistance